ncbi:hypothetical protein RRG08_067131 [Elysia crispata]|uniref:Peptidase M12B domain-containing protein n=1 Tax=Elysia crispata TaxID=231223 RepID=A0AAE0ZRS1_9GAST|nr:hypothetical protein RRG08_067131 [Elysia crispata]KAK3773413.1 hypothetical protein RRG08_067131 [Elysia crispata]KAK3773414.1 hypothetical protein RRG08_067131 [Elysia crispata]KAK3773415.1 hypothetical protein RRG08_067131 [Elysia crispata]KAK3773416.1 hypothetical protein RRG08_067131 [Elysia crispata]
MKDQVKVFLVYIFATSFLDLEVFSMPTHQGEGRFVKIDLLLEDWNSNARIRREADSNLPDQLSFQVPVTQEGASFLMSRCRLLPTATPFSNLTRRFSRNVAVYTDSDNMATMIVRRKQGQYTLRGSFLHNNTEWYLEPLEGVMDGRHTTAAGYHRLVSGRPNMASVAFIGDAVEDDEPPVEVLSLEERNRYSTQRSARLSGEGNEDNLRVTTGHHPDRKVTDQSSTATLQHVVEMAFVVDYADYERWVAYHGAANAEEELTVWYTYVAEGIDIRYRTISDPDIAIRTKVTFLKVLKTDAEDDFIEDLISSGTFDPMQGVNAFRNWIQDSSNGIPNADHYMYFTGVWATYISNADHYMYFTGFSLRGAIGYAYLDGVCTASGVSITVNDFTAYTAEVAAHELGHSLSAFHDSERRGCSDDTYNVMNAAGGLPVPASVTGNPWRFSKCSIASFKSYLSSVSCTEPQNTESTDTLPTPTGDARPGIALDRDDQCRQSYRNSASSYCSTAQDQQGGESELCRGMYCTEPGDPSLCGVIVPLEYTSCGSGKWCRVGFCLDEGVEPTNPPPGPPGPYTIFDCFPFLLRFDLLGLIICLSPRSTDHHALYRTVMVKHKGLGKYRPELDVIPLLTSYIHNKYPHAFKHQAKH